MAKKTRATEKLKVAEVKCRGFEVMVWWASGGVDAWGNCEIDADGQPPAYYASTFEEWVGSQKMKEGHQWRASHWRDRFDAVGVHLSKS